MTIGNTTVTLNVNGSLTSYGAEIIGDDGFGSLTVTNGASADIASVVIGNQSGGIGDLEVDDASSVSITGGLTAGNAVGSNGQIAVNGASATFTVGGNLDLGVNGFAGLAVTDSADFVVIGNLDEASGTGNSSTSFTGSASGSTIDGSWTIGDAGDSTDTIGGGFVLAVDGAVILGAQPKQGSQAASYGSLTLNDAGTTLNLSSGALIVGEGGGGGLTVNAGTTLNAGGANVIVGDSAGSYGALTVSGDGARFIAQSLTLGDSGQASVAFNAGADITVNGNLVIASNGGAPDVEVDDAATTVGIAGTLNVDSGGVMNIAAATVSAADVIVASSGAIAGSGTLEGAVTDNGVVTAQGGTLEFTGAVTGAAAMQIGDGGTLRLDVAGTTASVQFDGGTGALKLAAIGDFSGGIAGFAAGDLIIAGDLVGATMQVTPSGGNTVLSFSNGATSLGSLTLTGAYNTPVLGFDASNGTISDAACFVSGTLIETSTGPCAVEALAVGDLLVTRTGALRAIVWLGHRQIGSSQYPLAEKLWPVRVRAGAFGQRTPRRDLYLSPEHAIHHEGSLFAIGDLVNNASIAQVPRTAVTYWHIELATHDVLLAEGLEAESFLENANRGDFAGGTALTLHPELMGSQGAAASPCFPIRRQGAALQALRDRLEARIPGIAEAA
jgi:T5SS/PEP-CTERM-associated repeat protein